MNPYATPTILNDRRAKLEPLGMLSIAGFLSGALVGAIWFWPHGFPLACYAFFTFAYIATKFNLHQFSPVSRMKFSAIEFAVVLAICGILHGLLGASVQSNCKGQRQQQIPVSINASGTLNKMTLRDAIQSEDEQIKD